MHATLNAASTNQFYSNFERNMSNHRLWKFCLIVDHSSALRNIAQLYELQKNGEVGEVTRGEFLRF